MEGIKKIIIKHFGFLPEIVSTTEHAYASPPVRVVSSLFELSKFSQKKILRIIIEDKAKLDYFHSNLRIFLPHLSNKDIFVLNLSNKEFLFNSFNKDLNSLNDLLNQQKVFSFEEKINYLSLVNLYKQTFSSLNILSIVNFYNNFLKIYLKYLDLEFLSDWINFTPFIGTDSFKMKNFIKESFLYLHNKDLVSLNNLGLYLEEKNKLKIINSEGIIMNAKWNVYKNYVFSDFYDYLVSFEIILFIFSYYNVLHFGNDYQFSKKVMNLNTNSKLIQLTEHNKDFSFNIELPGIYFNKAFLYENKWNLSHRVYRNINSLPELYILLGHERLQKLFNNLITK